MRALMVGTGAMACLLASRMASAGVEVTMLGTWRAGVEALARDGVAVEGSGMRYPVQATTDPDRCSGHDLAIVLTKSPSTARAADQLASCLPPHGRVLTLQNGLGNREVLASRLGLHRVHVGVTTLGATLLGPALVRSAGEGDVLLEPEAERHFGGLLESAGLSSQAYQDVDALLWGKLVINAAINPVAAVTGLANGELIKQVGPRRLVAGAAREAFQVAGGLGVRLPYADATEAAFQVAERTAANRASMLQDLERGRPTELEAITGAVVGAARRLGLATPVNNGLYHLVKGLERALCRGA